MHGKYRSPAGRLILAAGAIAALASASFATSCSRKTAPQPAQAPSAPAQARPAGAPAAISPALRPARAAPLAASIRAFGLRAKSLPRIARDFSLGPLQSSRPAEGDEAAAFATARAFAECIAAGKLDKGLLLPEARDALSVLLAAPAPVPGALAYRLGAIALEGPAASLAIRLPREADAPRMEGLLSLRKVGETWYVEALALEAPASGALAFNPDSSAGPR
jgi:hypothetical protein